jgi:hypothetical protein
MSRTGCAAAKRGYDQKARKSLFKDGSVAAMESSATAMNAPLPPISAVRKRKENFFL